LRQNQIGGTLSITAIIIITGLGPPYHIDERQHDLNARRGQIHQFLRARKWEQALLEKSKDKEDSTKG
jgi:hypothetical protein